MLYHSPPLMQKPTIGSGGGGGGFGRPTYSPNNNQHRAGRGGSGIVVIAYLPNK